MANLIITKADIKKKLKTMNDSIEDILQVKTMNKTEIYDPIADRILGQENQNQNFRHLRRYEFLKK